MKAQQRDVGVEDVAVAQDQEHPGNSDSVGSTSGVDPVSSVHQKRTSGIRRIVSSLLGPSRGGPTQFDLLPPGPDWDIGEGGVADLLRVQVREVGCFYVKHIGGERWRCFNRLTAFEHVSYGTQEEVDLNLDRQSAIWREKLGGGPRKSPWKNNPLAHTAKKEA